ncbi:MAG: DUF4199 domain-containing protein [Polymorphobacter sp.]
MRQIIIRYGLTAGIVIAIPTFFISVRLADHPPEKYGMVIGYTTMLVALSLVFAGIKRHRDHNLGGVIRFWPALGLGLAISAIAGLFYVLTWESVLAVTGMDFGADYARLLIDQKRAAGANVAEMAAFTAEMATFQRQYANPLYRMPMTFAEILPVGVLVSLVSAGLLRNSRFLPARG